MAHFVAFRVLGAEIFAFEIGRAPAPDEERPKLEAGPGGVQEMGPTYQPGDVIATDGYGFRSCP